MKTVTNNKAITQVFLPEQPIPILVSVNRSQMEYRRQTGAIEAADGYFYEDVEKPVFVRLVSDELKALTVEENQVAFMAKYALTIDDHTLRNAFFCLMLAEAAKGLDPNESVLRALRYYRGSPPSELFGKGSPVSRSIQQQPFRVVLELLNTGLEKARPIVWWSLAKKRTSLGLYCPDGRTALFALALKGMGLPGGLGVCQHCGNPFHRSRRTQRYCSHRCQLTASMRRFRERHAAEHKSNKRTKPFAHRDLRRKKR